MPPSLARTLRQQSVGGRDAANRQTYRSRSSAAAIRSGGRALGFGRGRRLAHRRSVGRGQNHRTRASAQPLCRVDASGGPDAARPWLSRPGPRFGERLAGRAGDVQEGCAQPRVSVCRHAQLPDTRGLAGDQGRRAGDGRAPAQGPVREAAFGAADTRCRCATRWPAQRRRAARAPPARCTARRSSTRFGSRWSRSSGC